MRRHLYLLVFISSLFLAILILPQRALCQDDSIYPSLYSNNFVIDTYPGPQICSLRVTTLGGAYAGIAERAQGIMTNPVAVAQRVWYSKYLFDVDAGYAYMKPGLLLGKNMDLDNDGDRSFSYNNFLMGVVYGAVRAGRAGGGGVTRLQRFTLGGEGERKMSVWLGHSDIAFGYSFLEDLILIGAGFRVTFMNIHVLGMEVKNALTYTMGGLVTGVLFRFKRIPMRVGLSGAIPLSRTQRSWTKGVTNCLMPNGSTVRKVAISGACDEQSMIIPKGIAFPWTVRLGFAYYIGKLKWNEHWNLQKRQYQHSNKVPTKSGDYQWSSWQSQYELERSEIDRRYVMFALDVEVVGGVKNGIGVEGFLNQKLKTSEGIPTVSIHGGIESEVWADRLVLRLGAYAEPSRFKRKGYRGHGTFGFDVKLFSICWGSSKVSFRGGAGMDAARDYFNVGFTVGFWR